MSDHRWVSVTDDDLTDSERRTLDAVLPMALDIGAGAATTCGYDKRGYPLGSLTVAFVGEVVIGIAVRNAHDEHAVVVSVMEPIHEHTFKFEEWSYNDECRYLICDCGVKMRADA